jgi:hypothetical protein
MLMRIVAKRFFLRRLNDGFENTRQGILGKNEFRGDKKILQVTTIQTA